MSGSSQAELDNHSDQLNPNNDTFWDDRGHDGRPDDWEDRLEEDNLMPDDDDD